MKKDLHLCKETYIQIWTETKQQIWKETYLHFLQTHLHIYTLTHAGKWTSHWKRAHPRPLSRIVGTKRDPPWKRNPHLKRDPHLKRNLTAYMGETYLYERPTSMNRDVHTYMKRDLHIHIWNETYIYIHEKRPTYTYMKETYIYIYEKRRTNIHLHIRPTNTHTHTFCRVTQS